MPSRLESALNFGVHESNKKRPVSTLCTYKMSYVYFESGTHFYWVEINPL